MLFRSGNDKIDDGDDDYDGDGDGDDGNDNGDDDDEDGAIKSRKSQTIDVKPVSTEQFFHRVALRSGHCDRYL